MNKKSLCIIPARNGSKRIFQKKQKIFIDKPIICYSIELAINSNLFEEIFVSTDSEEIQMIAKNYNINYEPRRSEENSNDTATTSSVINEVLSYKNISISKFKYVCCIYPTAPLINIKDLRKAQKILEKSNVDSVVPIIQFEYPIQRALNIKKNGLLSFVNSKNENSRSQDFEKKYHDAGQFYFFKTESFQEYNKLFMPKTSGIIIDRISAQDIDDPDDWDIAEFKYKYLNDFNSNRRE